MTTELPANTEFLDFLMNLADDFHFSFRRAGRSGLDDAASHAAQRGIVALGTRSRDRNAEDDSPSLPELDPESAWKEMSSNDLGALTQVLALSTIWQGAEAEMMPWKGGFDIHVSPDTLFALSAEVKGSLLDASGCYNFTGIQTGKHDTMLGVGLGRGFRSGRLDRITVTLVPRALQTRVCEAKKVEAGGVIHSLRFRPKVLRQMADDTLAAELRANTFPLGELPGRLETDGNTN